jgi:hypothetical protein
VQFLAPLDNQGFVVDRASDNTIGRTLEKTLSVRQAKLALSSR